MNPAHLFLGTQKDNIQDAISKERMASGTRSHNRRNHILKLLTQSKPEVSGHPQARGEKHGHSKLTESEVRELRYLGLTMTHKQLAEKFGISQTTISNILSWKLWAHVR